MGHEINIEFESWKMYEWFHVSLIFHENTDEESSASVILIIHIWTHCTLKNTSEIQSMHVHVYNIDPFYSDVIKL